MYQGYRFFHEFIVQGKAATLHCLAILKAGRGEIDGAIALFEQSLALTEKIGNVQTKAITLWWLGHLADILPTGINDVVGTFVCAFFDLYI